MAAAEVSPATPPAKKKTKKATLKKAKTAIAKSKVEPAHPSYLQMSSEAIAVLKERTGSSQYAIAKYIDSKYRGVLPPNFKKLLSVQLRNLVKQDKLVKVKSSYKLSDELKRKFAPKRMSSTVPKAPVSLKVPKSPKKRVLTKAKGAPQMAKSPKKGAKPAKKATPKKAAAPKSPAKPAPAAAAPPPPPAASRKKSPTPRKAAKKPAPKTLKATPKSPAKSPVKPATKSPKPKLAPKMPKSKKSPAKKAKKA